MTGSSVGMDEGKTTTALGAAASAARAQGCARQRVGGARRSIAHFPQRVPDTLLGLASLPFFFALLALEALQRGQKPRRLWLAKDHGDHSFRDDSAQASQGCSCWVGLPAPVVGFTIIIGSSPAFAPAMPER